mgnify:CR=1 FL=1
MNIRDAQELLTNQFKLSRDSIEKLSLFHDELLKFNSRYNLIAKSTEDFIWDRHILDSAQINTYIDFKDAYADDFDSRIITSGAKQLQFFTGGQGASLCALQTGTGKVGIATDAVPTVAKLQIHSDKLGGTAGNTQELLYLTSPDNSNLTSYRFTTYRHTDGTSHAQSEGRLRRHVDATDMGFIGFGDGYVNIGYGTAEKVVIDSSGHVLPGANNTQDLGSSSKRWRDIYTGDLNLSNKGRSNDVDGSWGDYTIQEGESDLFLINNRSGKKFKFNLTEVL